MRLSKTQIRTIENELENKNALIVRPHGRRVLIKVRPRRIYPSEGSTRLVRIYKDDWQKVKDRAKCDGTSMSVALDSMLIEAFRHKVTRLLQGVLLNKQVYDTRAPVRS